MRKQKPDWLVRNFTLGVEDSLVSTVGLLSGVAVAGVDRPTVILTGLVLIFVEAFSMGIGSLLTEHAVTARKKNHEVPLASSFSGGLAMFLSYFGAGFVPLTPYAFFPVNSALVVSAVLSLTVLFGLGVVNGRGRWRKRVTHHGLETLLLGGGAILVGVMVGKLVNMGG